MTAPAQLPALTAQQMADVDRAMFERFGLDVLQIMELAGQAVAAFARSQFLIDSPVGKRVLVLAGSGGNGGDAMVAARQLHAWGAEVTVWLTHAPDQLRGPAGHQAAVLSKMGVPMEPRQAGQNQQIPDADLVLDGLLGYSLKGAPRGLAAELIRAANGQPAPILAIDVPSGLDATSGEVYDPCINATATLTLDLPKTGLLTPSGRQQAGILVAADIGMLPAAHAAVGVDAGPVFAERAMISLG